MRRARTIAVWLVSAALLTQTRITPASADQNVASTGLALRIIPEARIMPSSIPLAFDVSGSGTADPQPVTVEAWFRALPNYKTGLNAQITDLAGQPGGIPASDVHWDVVTMSGAGGGGSGQCTPQAAAGSGILCRWSSPGKATVRITFSIAAASLPAGHYSGRVDFSLINAAQ
jgi:hypothetical protein